MANPVYNLDETHTDNIGEIIAAADINALADAVNELSRRRAMQWPKHITGTWHGPGYILEASSTAQTLVANQIYAFWLPIPEPDTAYDRIELDVQTAGTAGKLARLMVYDDDGAGGKPGTLLLDAGTVLVDSTGSKAITINFTPPHGGVWIAVVSDGTPNLWASGADKIKHLGAELNTTPYRGWSFANGSTTAPSPFPSGATLVSNVFVMHLRLRKT